MKKLSALLFVVTLSNASAQLEQTKPTAQLKGHQDLVNRMRDLLDDIQKGTARNLMSGTKASGDQDVSSYFRGAIWRQLAVFTEEADEEYPVIWDNASMDSYTLLTTGVKSTKVIAENRNRSGNATCLAEFSVQDKKIVNLKDPVFFGGSLGKPTPGCSWVPTRCWMEKYGALLACNSTRYPRNFTFFFADRG